MSENDKMIIFGQYLTEMAVRNKAMLFSTCQNVQQPIDAIRLKYGHLECSTEILAAFTLLYNGDVNDFKKAYIEEDEKEKKEDDGS